MLTLYYRLKKYQSDTGHLSFVTSYENDISLILKRINDVTKCALLDLLPLVGVQVEALGAFPVLQFPITPAPGPHMVRMVTT